MPAGNTLQGDNSIMLDFTGDGIIDQLVIDWRAGLLIGLSTAAAGATMARLRKVTVVTGVGAFVDKHRLQVETKDGRKTVRFTSAIIAAAPSSPAPTSPRPASTTSPTTG